MSLLNRTAAGAVACALTVGVAAASAASTTALKASLKGSNETEKGDPNGRGTATVRIKGTQLCYTLSLKNVATTNAGHIHRGKSGVAGAVVVPLYMGTPKTKGCVTVKASLAKEIAKTPSGFYVNVHNAAYPGGAMRGQLSKG